MSILTILVILGTVAALSALVVSKDDILRNIGFDTVKYVVLFPALAVSTISCAVYYLVAA